MWIACAYRDQALDPKDFVRAASNAARGRKSAARTPIRHVTGAFLAYESACPQIVLASVWIACAYQGQALDPKDFVRAASNAARRPAPRRMRPRAGLSTLFVGKHVDILSMRDLSR